MESRSGVDVIYDGECPFCTAFVKMARLRETFGQVRLIDARQSALPLIQRLRETYLLDDGFVIIHGGREYYGPAALEFLSLATADSGWARFLFRLPLFRGRFGQIVYPMLVRGRKLALRLLGRRLLGY
jgi:predicted DCC family thiol-disulfide oxidoreductase YuxK